MKHLILFLLFLSSPVFGQKNNVFHREPFRIDSMPQQGIPLNKGWVWHKGDNPAWALPDFDDSHWDTIRPTTDIHYLPQVRKAQMGWLRLHFRVDTTISHQSLVFTVRQMGASAIFLNGKLIRQFGAVSIDPEQEETFDPKNEPFTVVLGRQPDQVLAVRYSFTDKNPYIKNTNNTFQGNPCFSIRLRRSDDAWRSTVNRHDQFLGTDNLLTGFFLMLGFIHLFFFLAYPIQRANLFFAVNAFSSASIGIIDARSFIAHTAEAEFLNNIYYLLAALMSLFAMLTAVYEFVNHPKAIIYKLLISHLFLCPLYLYFFYEWGWFLAFYGNYLLVYAETARISYIAIRQKKPDITYLFWTQVLGLLAILSFLLNVLPAFQGLLKGNWLIIFNTAIVGLTILPLAISFLLAREFSRTSRQLSDKLLEVKALSAQAIAQEQEKQLLLATQNERLEQQVEQRTAELKASQAQLIQKEKLASLGELTAGIAHEIQNPLNFVNNFSELSVELAKELKGERLKVKEDRDEELENELVDDLILNQEKINQHGKRAASIVKGMLEHSRLTTGERQLTDLKALADEYLRLSYHGLSAKDNMFSADYALIADENLPKINVVPQEIGRVMLNLINNAFYAVNERIKLGEAGYQPKMTVSLKSTESPSDRRAVEIVIKDNGPGIPAAIFTKIFQPFFTTKPTGEGTGLGLSLAYDIVTKGHNGTLTVESTEGEGAAFKITLPG